MVPKPPTKKTQSKEAPLKVDRAGVFSVSFRVAELFQKAEGKGGGSGESEAAGEYLVQQDTVINNTEFQ